MKFLLVTDYFYYGAGAREPLGMLYILAALREGGHEIKLVEDNFAKASSLIEAWKPEFIGYCVYTGYQERILKFNRELKKKYRFLSVFGGPHPTFFPEMIESDGVDIICRGEGEEAIVELLNRIENKEVYTDVRNFWVKKEGNIYRNPVRPYQEDLGSIAHPARDIFYQFPATLQSKVRVVITARGCPYSCTYCYNYKVKELYKGCSTKHLRFRPVDDVIDEIQAIKDNYPIDFIYFGTDCFTASKKWSLEFAEKYKKLSIPFWCMTRPETTSLEVCEALKSCGGHTMSLGVESGSEELRRTLLNRTMSNNDIIKAAAAIKQAGLKLYTFNMMALPEETLEQAYSTMEINQKCKTDYPAVTLFQPYPRTSLTEDAIKKGLFDGDYDKLSKSYYQYSALKNPHRKELENLQKLLSIAVEFPFLTSFIKFLIKLPLGRLYLEINKLHKAYCFFFRITPIKVTFKEFMGLVWQLIKDPS